MNIQRPVWLFSMDSDHFHAAPTTTGALKAYYLHYGSEAAHTDINLLHFKDDVEIQAWVEQQLLTLVEQCKTALAAGVIPVLGFSFYTWNAAEFLDLIHNLKTLCPGALVIAGGPHVQQPEDYLQQDHIDLVFMGEGEATLHELLDNPQRDNWPNINGLAFLDASGHVLKTAERKRQIELDKLPSALDIIALTGPDGKPLYDSISYETSRGCPFKCAFCEWGTGAIGTKMYQHSMARITADWNKVIDAGIQNIWLADSNFGALKEDIDKARLICDFKQHTGLPKTFATSWSKKHSPKVQQIVLMLHQHGLLPHYQLALQTLTPLALELSNRSNMDANKYEPIAKQMAAAGVPIAAELIWGLPGDNLADFENNLDTLLASFPNINIFGYTLLPGTEFYEKREQYKIEAIPVAGYGKAKGEYVVGCHTFSRDEGIEGYFLITAHMILIHGYVMPLVTRLLAMQQGVPATPLLRLTLRALLDEYHDDIEAIDTNDRMAVYEGRAQLYLMFMNDLDRSFDCIERALREWLQQHQVDTAVFDKAINILHLDKACCPRQGKAHLLQQEFSFNADSAARKLMSMELPTTDDFILQQQVLHIEQPGGIGDVLKDPDGGSWIKGNIVQAHHTDTIASSASH
jgi:hypothetical protein